MGKNIFPFFSKKDPRRSITEENIESEPHTRRDYPSSRSFRRFVSIPIDPELTIPHKIPLKIPPKVPPPLRRKLATRRGTRRWSLASLRLWRSADDAGDDPAAANADAAVRSNSDSTARVSLRDSFKKLRNSLRVRLGRRTAPEVAITGGRRRILADFFPVEIPLKMEDEVFSQTKDEVFVEVKR